MSQLVKFCQSLLSGYSPDVAVIARVAAADIRSPTSPNNRLIMESTVLGARAATSQQDVNCATGDDGGEVSCCIGTAASK